MEPMGALSGIPYQRVSAPPEAPTPKVGLAGPACVVFRAGPFCMEPITLVKISISVAGFAALAVVVLTGRLDAALPFAAVVLGFALYGTPSGLRGG